ncbi:Mor transcription activator family protein [Thiorhodococcus minor]|uniref:Mor transcription activator domain-containing protein n=1 Tax=Thiorhodococcus minor TaxID=57489 RepID=A0A6M0K004_9GAMM|nr:Mor transcription activator family protein [Thiorhodococcus minor]NEV62263.1 hypothetical protein [Thiorhodococcus minor]
MSEAGGALMAILHGAVMQAALSAGVRADVAQGIADTSVRRLREVAGGDTAYIPGPSKRERNRHIIAAFRAGVAIARLSAQYRLSERRIRQILSEARHG